MSLICTVSKRFKCFWNCLTKCQKSNFHGMYLFLHMTVHAVLIILWLYVQGHSELRGVAFHYESGGWFEQDIQGDQESIQKGKEQKQTKTTTTFKLWINKHNFKHIYNLATTPLRLSMGPPLNQQFGDSVPSMWTTIWRMLWGDCMWRKPLQEIAKTWWVVCVQYMPVGVL